MSSSSAVWGSRQVRLNTKFPRSASHCAFVAYGAFTPIELRVAVITYNCKHTIPHSM